MTTVRDLIIERQAEVRNSADLLPERAAEILAELSALLWLYKRRNQETRRRVQPSAFDRPRERNQGKQSQDKGADFPRVCSYAGGA